METILTERLVLRPFWETDYDDLYECLSQLRDDEFEGYPGITYENGRQHLAYRIGSEEFYAVELRESGKVIGNIYCGNRDFDAREVGYIINGNYRRRGYALEALAAVIGAAFRSGLKEKIAYSLFTIYRFPVTLKPFYRVIGHGMRDRLPEQLR